MKYSMCEWYEPNLAWLGRIKPEIPIQFLLSVHVLLGEQKQRAPSLLNTHLQAFAHTHLRTLLPLLNVEADMYCLWLLGKWSEKQVWGCGFRLRVSEWRDPEASGVWYYPAASCPIGLGQGMGMGGGGDGLSLREEGGRPFKAKSHGTPWPKGSLRQESFTQPTAPTVLPSGPEPQPDPTVVCFTTLNRT